MATFEVNLSKNNSAKCAFTKNPDSNAKYRGTAFNKKNGASFPYAPTKNVEVAVDSFSLVKN